MRSLPILFALVVSFLSASAHGQIMPWPRFHGNGDNNGLGWADGSNGFGQWKFPTSGPVNSSPAIDQNWNVYFGTTDGKLIALDEHGKLRWSFQAGGEVFSPAVGPDGGIYVGSADGYIYDLDAGSGSVTWKFAAKGPIRTTPAFDKFGSVVFGSDDHYCYGLKSDGTLLWKFQTGSTVSLSPAVAPGDREAYFAADDNNIYDIDTVQGNGNVISFNSAGFGSSPVMGPDGMLYVASLDSNLYAFSGSSVVWTFQADSPIRTTPAIGLDNTIYFGTDAGTLYAYNHANPLNQQQNWVCIQPNGPIRSSPALGDGGVVYFGCDDGHLYAAQAPGNVVWQAFTDGSMIRSSPAITYDGTVMVGSQDSNLYAVGTQSPVPVSSITVQPSSVVGGSALIGTVTLSSQAPMGGDVVNLRVDQLAASVPPVVIVPQFHYSTQFTVTTLPVGAPVTVKLFAVSGFTILSTSFTVTAAPLVLLTILPNSVVGGNGATGTVEVGAPTPPGGEEVTLFTSNPDAFVPMSTIVQYQSTTGTFPVVTAGVDKTETVTITASAGGVSLKAPLTITPANLVSVTVLPTSVVGGVQNAIGTINLDGLPPAEGALVALKSSDTNAVSVPASLLVTWDPVKMILVNTFPITTSSVLKDDPVTISATYRMVTKNTVLTVTPPQLTTFVLNPTSVLGGQSCTGTVTLSSVTAVGGVTVQLVSNGSDIQVPPAIFIPAGNNSASFTVTTTGVPTVKTEAATASFDGVSINASLTINPPVTQGLTIAPALVVGGAQVAVTGTVLLSGPSGTPGDVVTLTSSDTTLGTVPASITLAAGAKTGTFNIVTFPVLSSRTLTITASFNGTSQKATVTINPFVINGVNVVPNSVAGGSTTTGYVVVSAVAGPTGFVVNLSTDKPDAQAPKTVAIPTGSATGTFTITTRSVTKQEAILVTAAYGTSSNTGNLTLTPSSLATLTISPTSVVGGNNATGTVTVNGTAPSGGFVVSLSSSTSSAVPPKSVTIPGSSGSVTFTIQTKGVATATVATITAKLAKISVSAKLTIQPSALVSLSVSPSTVIGGSATTVMGTVTLAGNGANTVVNLSCSNTKAATVPPSVKVPPGKSSVTFTVTHMAVTAPVQVTITSSSDGVEETALLTVNPFQVVSLSLAPTSLVGGSTSSGTVSINAAAGARAISVALVSSSSAATVPATVSVPAKATSGKFTVKTIAVSSDTTVQITGSIGASSAHAALIVQAPVLKSLTVAPASVKGSSATKVTGTVTISAAAPASGLLIALSSSATAASAPATVTILAGKTSATFTVGHQAVTSQIAVTISAQLNGSSKTATLTLTSG